MRTDPQRPKQQSAECSRENPYDCIFIYHKLEIRAFLFAILLIIRTILTLNHQTVVIMNADKFIEDAVKDHNETNPDIVIRKIKIDTLTLYFLYLQEYNVWGAKECRLFLFLKEKLNQERIDPFIGLDKIYGEDKIGIFIDVNSEL